MNRSQSLLHTLDVDRKDLRAAGTDGGDRQQPVRSDLDQVGIARDIDAGLAPGRRVAGQGHAIGPGLPAVAAEYDMHAGSAVDARDDAVIQHGQRRPDVLQMRRGWYRVGPGLAHVIGPTGVHRFVGGVAPSVRMMHSSRPSASCAMLGSQYPSQSPGKSGCGSWAS